MLGAGSSGYRHEAHDEPLPPGGIRPGDGAVSRHPAAQIHDFIGVHQLLLRIGWGAVGVDKLRDEACFLFPVVYAGTGRDGHLAQADPLAGGQAHAEVAPADGGEADGLLTHAAQILILRYEVADPQEVLAVLRDFEHADVGQLAEAAAEEARRVGLCQRLVRGWHLHRRRAGLALRRGLVGDATGCEGRAEIEE